MSDTPSKKAKFPRPPKRKEFWAVYHLGHIFSGDLYLNRAAAESKAHPGDLVVLFREVRP